MFDKDSLHHAYFIEGERAAILADVERFLNGAFGIVRQGHPDVHYAEYQSFGIDESRALQDMQTMKPVRGDRKIFIVAADSITSEAQNSLLKVFEEPTPGTHFFVISSSQRVLLPTLRSRMSVVTHGSAGTASTEANVKRFIKLPPKGRLEFVAPLIEEKDRAKAEDFLQALLGELHASKGATPSMKELLALISYLKDRASSIKLILERVALMDL
jgi:hypothetical protein